MNETRSRELEALEALVGRWEVEATHPLFAGAVHGAAEVEWLEGRRFLIYRTHADHPDAPDAIQIIGEEDGRLRMHYFDSRGVHRVYGVDVRDGVWRMWRDAPGFSQRFEGTVAGDTISGLWKLSRDGSTWDDDLRITFRRAGHGSPADPLS